MELYNITRQVTLVSQLEFAGTFGRRLRGLLGRRQLAAGSGLLLAPCRAVHTCFMAFNIDVLFVDEEFNVLFIMEDMRPYVISPTIPEARMVLELPAGVVQATGTRLGDILKVIGQVA